MAGTKISALTALTTVADGDLFPIVDVSDTTQAPTGTTKSMTAEVVADYTGRLIQPFVDPRWFGAVGDGTTNDTAAIQAALDFAEAAGGGVVLLPPLVYSITQIEIPATVWLKGSGWHGFGTNATMLKHVSAQTVDMIRFAVNADGFIGPCGLTDMQLLGHPSSTGGYGIQMMNAAGTKGKMQDASTIERLYVRGFFSDGIKSHGGFPLNLSHIDTLWNGGYGIRIVDDGTSVFGASSLVNLIGISGDGNSGGATLRCEGFQHMTAVAIHGIKGERRDNSDRGGVDQQPHVIEFDNCAGSVSIDGLENLSIGASTTKPGDAITATGAAKPSVVWSGAAIRTLASQTVGAEPFMFNDGVITFAKTVDNGHYNSTKGFVHGNYDGVKPSVTDHYFGVGGVTPGIGLWESDAATDEKLWAWVASSGDLYLRALPDAGGTGINPIVIARTGTAVTSMSIATHVIPGAHLTHNLGSAAAAWLELFTAFIRFTNSGALPAADVSLRGQIRWVTGGAGVADGLHICRKNAADAYEWAPLT